MSKTNHDHATHRCNCDHADVKYCRTCRIVHCLDCKQEWGSHSYAWTYTYPYPTSTTYPSAGTYLTSTTYNALDQYKAQKNTLVGQNVTLATTAQETKCSHQ
jgi:hypothetical protein